ncbi:MAG TPA: aldehyde dehydrogenase family protein [Thermoplasmata archaeon]|nr:aldehyde dehydrogenase family protein [Thermoplasmata archaeon]
MAGEAAYGLIVGGAELPASGGATDELLDPSTNRPLARVAVGDAEDASRAMESAQRAFESTDWAGGDGTQRARALAKLARLLGEHLEEFATLETRNMGKTLREARIDIGFVVRTLEYVSGLADKLEGTTIPVPGSRFNYTVREPLGVTVHIAPWNYPLLLAMRSVAPALAAGNTAVLKPASLTPLTAIRLGRLARDAGIPDGVLNVVPGPGGRLGEVLVRDRRCRSVSFTGSGEVGRRIAAIAAERLIPATLELGGKSPVLVLPDADLDRAARGVALGIFGNAGQMCWAGSRLIVHEAVREALLAKLRAIAEATKLGPGLESDTEMGPLVSREQEARVLDYVRAAREDGGRLVTGGAKATGGTVADGNFVQPTVLDGLDPGSRAVREEIFGPVLATFSCADLEEGIRLANATAFGLCAGVWTRDLATAHYAARRLEAGIVVVNEPPLTFPQTPFGGHKESGLGSEQGIGVVAGYTRTKNVLLNVAVPKRKA